MTRDGSHADGADQPQVFVSYARKDAAAVDAITRLLEEAGVSVWRDSERILGGQYFGEEIVHAIAHSRVLLVMCSPHSLMSDNVFREVALTWDYHRRYLPVWLSAPVEIPARIRYAMVSPQWVEAHSGPPEEWMPRLLKALSAMGVDIKGSSPKPGSGEKPSGESRPGLRFKPGDRPVAGSDWVLERLLGKGGFGEVWKAHYPHLQGQPPVALKFCLELDARGRDLLRHEADMVLRAQKQIRSDGIVPLLHAYLNNDPPCLEYPYIEGGTLVRLLDESRQSPAGSFTPAQVERIILQVARIVGPAHRADPRLVHRDLKPSNVLVERLAEGKVKLRVTDFGIGGLAAQPALERSRASSSLEGDQLAVLTGAYSPLYASPQQMKGEKPDPRDDVYALGVIWHQLLTGDLSSPAPTGRRWLDALRQKGTSDAALDLLSSCLESSRAHRPDDAVALGDALAAIAQTPAKKADATKVVALPVDKVESLSVGVEPAPAPKTRPAALPRQVEPTITPDARTTRDHFDAGNGRSRGRLAAGILSVCALLGVIVYVVTDTGTVKITGTDDRMKVSIDGRDIRIENVGQPITIRAGKHDLLVTRDGLTVKTEAFEINRGKEKVLEVRYTRRDLEAEEREAESLEAERKAAEFLAAERKAAASKPSAAPSAAAKTPAPTVPVSPSPRNEAEYITTETGRIKLKLIPAGEFMMGSDDGQGEADERPRHKVRITQSFYLGVHEVTQGQYETVMGRNPSHFSLNGRGKDKIGQATTDTYPVESVSWHDAVLFCNKLSEREGLKPFYQIDGETLSIPSWSENGYRLPTEAEWEYAAGGDPKDLDGSEWYDKNSGGVTHPVVQKQANGLGLHDMLGNVWEWCWDAYDADYYKLSPSDDPRGPSAASLRVLRGGSWYFDPRYCRSAFRSGFEPGSRILNLGFRVARGQSQR